MALQIGVFPGFANGTFLHQALFLARGEACDAACMQCKEPSGVTKALHFGLWQLLIVLVEPRGGIEVTIHTCGDELVAQAAK